MASLSRERAAALCRQFRTGSFLSRIRSSRPAFFPSARLVLAFDALPLEKAPPVRGERAQTAIRAVENDEEGVVPEEREDLLRVVGEVVVERRARGHAGLLQIDYREGQAV
jgi:hypothetical protein